MPRWRIWDRSDQPAEPGGDVNEKPRRTATHGTLPRPMQPTAGRTSGNGSDRLARLRRRRESILFEMERAELATQEDNPWQERISLLTEALAAVEADRERLAQEPSRPGVAVPPVPIADVAVEIDSVAEVSFRIGDESFKYAEEIDWAERGTTVVRGELQHVAGDPARVAPEGIPADRRDELVEHLTASLFVFASDLRDRALSGEALPDGPTLSGLAVPCPECGGWKDWAGHCAACARRAWREQQLRAEALRLDGERTREAEERNRVVEVLPIARRRLADVDAEIAALGG